MTLLRHLHDIHWFCTKTIIQCKACFGCSRDALLYRRALSKFAFHNRIMARCTHSYLDDQCFIIRRSVRRLNTLSPVTSEGSQNLVPFLETPVVVIAGLVVSAGNCSVENMIMHMNVSIRDRQVDCKFPSYNPKSHN